MEGVSDLHLGDDLKVVAPYVFYGGALAAGAVVLLFAHRQAWPLGDVADLLAFPLPLGHALGRVGCFWPAVATARSPLLACAFPQPASRTKTWPARACSRRAGPTPTLAPTQLYASISAVVQACALPLG